MGLMAHPDAKRARGSPMGTRGTSGLGRMFPKERSRFSRQNRGGVPGWQEGRNNGLPATAHYKEQPL